MSATPAVRAMARQQFVPAMQRPACRNCTQALEVNAAGSSPRWQCRKGGFMTTAMAWCDSYEPVCSATERAGTQPGTQPDMRRWAA